MATISSWLTQLSKAARIGLVCSVAWLLVVFAVTVEVAQDYGGHKLTTFLSVFVICGVLPVAVGWGVRWIMSAK
jgi:hypothetical protein